MQENRHDVLSLQRLYFAHLPPVNAIMGHLTVFLLSAFFALAAAQLGSNPNTNTVSQPLDLMSYLLLGGDSARKLAFLQQLFSANNTGSSLATLGLLGNDAARKLALLQQLSGSGGANTGSPLALLGLLDNDAARKLALLQQLSGSGSANNTGSSLATLGLLGYDAARKLALLQQLSGANALSSPTSFILSSQMDGMARCLALSKLFNMQGAGASNNIPFLAAGMDGLSECMPFLAGLGNTMNPSTTQQGQNTNGVGSSFSTLLTTLLLANN
ncbi:hypothetical protein ACOMHN_035966 [Nucella lapillus]